MRFLLVSFAAVIVICLCFFVVKNGFESDLSKVDIRISQKNETVIEQFEDSNFSSSDNENRENLDDFFAEIEKFDEQKYRDDENYRKDYLSSVVSARANQSAKHQRGVWPLKLISDMYYEVKPGTRLQFKAQGKPHMPISFATTKSGTFQNGKSAITLQADEEGIVSVEFTSTEEVIETVLLSSPVNSGRKDITIRNKDSLK